MFYFMVFVYEFIGYSFNLADAELAEALFINPLIVP